MIARYHFYIFIILIAGCIDDAPRDNPLDPLSPAYTGAGSMTGAVTIANQPTAVAGAVITDLDENIFVITDTLGYFVFNHLSTGLHRFVCTKENYTNDTFQIDIQDRASVHVVRNLNGAPVVLSQVILTRKIDRYFPSPEYFVDVTADVTDPNSIAELDSVWFTVVDTLRFPMTYSVASKKFETTIYKKDLPTNTIQFLVGEPLSIVSRDRNNAVNISEPFYVTRVIEGTPTPDSPSPFKEDTVKADSLIFRWIPPDVTFNFTYDLYLWRVETGTSILIWSRRGLDFLNEQWNYSDDATAVPLDTMVSYAWSVSIVDDFGNYARSKESSFVVK